MRISLKNILTGCLFLCLTLSCSNYFKDDYKDNSPTSGKLKIYFDEGLQLHVKNQVFTFESQYPSAHMTPVSVTEDEAVQALYNDSCESIVISRLLTPNEKKVFESKNYFPKYSQVAKSGVAIITNIRTPLSNLKVEDVVHLLSHKFPLKDSVGNSVIPNVLIDKNNSAVMHYLSDSLLKGKKLSDKCSSLNSTLESINYVAQNKNTIAFIDFAWLSDTDDLLYQSMKDKIKFIGVEGQYPSQSSFKTGVYPFTRGVYVMRKTGGFTLAKGFESFVAGPKGQLIFLKQGLLPYRQAERIIEVKMEPVDVNK